MPDIKITHANEQSAVLCLAKELWAQNMVLAEMLNILVAKAEGSDEKESWRRFERMYKSRLEEINTYIAAEYGTLDVSELVKPGS